MRGCGVSRRYIDVCYCDMFSVVNVYLDHEECHNHQLGPYLNRPLYHQQN